MLEIDVTTAPSQTVRVELEGTFYVLRFRFNGRAERWFMDLYDDDEVLLAGSLPLCVGTLLTGHLRHRAGMPPGAFSVVDSTGSGTDPAEADLGERVKVVYLTAEETDAMQQVGGVLV